MRNIWVAVIGVLTLTLFAGTGFATAPVADDIPDIRLLTGSGTVDDFDLNQYVTDYDDNPEDLIWSIPGYTGFDGGANPAVLTDNLVDIGGQSSATQGVVTYRVEDASGFNYANQEDTQVVKYSSFWLVGPSLTQDNNLVPPNDFPRTWVIQADSALTTPDLSTLLVGAATADMTVSIASLAGEWLAGDNVTDVTYGDLNASIAGGGELVLKAPTGKYPLTGDQLTGAYRVGVKAKLTGGGLAGANDNWDGAELLVSTAQFPTGTVGFTEQPSTAARLDQFNGFEVTGAPVDLPINQDVMRLLADGANPRWYAFNAPTGRAQVVSTGIPTSTWATSGNALKVHLTSASDIAFLASEWFTNIQPGETLTLQANVTTSVGAGTYAPGLLAFVGNFHVHSNYSGGSWSVPNLTDIQVPTGNEWRTLKVQLKADAVGATVLNGTEEFNFYQRGYQCAMVIGGGALVTYPCDVFIDNIRLFRDQDLLDAAYGATVVDVTAQSLLQPFDGTFESAADLTGAGWTIQGGVTTGTAQLGVGDVAKMPTHEGNKALEVFLPLAAGQTVVTYAILAPAETGPGIYGMTCWLKSNAGAVKDCPDVMLLLADPAFRHSAWASTGFAGLPLADGGWKKMSLSSARVGTTVNRLWAVVIQKTGGVALTYAYIPAELKGTNSPGYESDAHVYYDDFKIHKYLDEITYFDRSVFPATD